MKPPIAIDLFSGCGGLTLGLKKAGFRVVGAVDNHALSVETYKANHPEVQVWERDIRGLPVSNLRRELGLRKGQLDLLAGCPPCQAFSTLRTWNGGKRVYDKRTKDLVLEFVRFAKKLRPKVIMLENVPGLARNDRMRVLQKKLGHLGYWSEYRILNVAKYGVPQRRRRVLLLASRVGPVEFARKGRKLRTVKSAIGSLPHPKESRDKLHKPSEKRSERIQNLIRRIPRNGGSRAALGKRAQLECHKECDGFKDIYGRMCWRNVSPTITSGCLNPSKGRFLHPTQDRAITLREAALLQTFPHRYRFPLHEGRYAVAAMIGNALPPEFVRRQAVKIERHLEQVSY